MGSRLSKVMIIGITAVNAKKKKNDKTKSQQPTSHALSGQMENTLPLAQSFEMDRKPRKSVL